MIKLFKNVKKNIGRGVIIVAYGRPCKRRIKAIIPNLTDRNGTVTFVDVSKGRFGDYTVYRSLNMDSVRPLEEVWDNWHAYMQDCIAALDRNIADLDTELAEEDAKMALEGRTTSIDLLEGVRSYRDSLVKQCDQWRKLLARADAAQIRRRGRRKQARELKATKEKIEAELFKERK